MEIKKLRDIVDIARPLPVKVLRLAQPFVCSAKVILEKQANSDFDMDKMTPYLDYKVCEAFTDFGGWIVVTIKEPKNGN